MPLALALAGCSGSVTPSGTDPVTVASPAPTPSQSAAPLPSPSPAISPGGGTLLFGRAVAGLEDRFVLMSPDGAGEHELDLPTIGCTACAVGSPDGRFIAVPIETAAGVGTAVLDAGGEGYREMPLPAGLNLAPRSWSPQGDRLAYDGWSDDDPSRTGAYVSAADGSGLKQIVPSPDGLDWIPMGYSPDGRLLLLFVDGGTDSDMEHAGHLYVVDANGGEPRQLNPAGTVLLGFDIIGFNPASWSPDSRSVAFAAFDGDGVGGRSAFFVADVDTLAPRQVSAWTRWSPYARWSPTGDWIAFGDVVDGERSISVVKPDGTDERTLTKLNDRACGADWSPDGQFLVHQRGPEGSSDLWVMDLTGHAIQVTDTPASYIALWWLP
jgi:Tol biopolymer transport system component